MSESWKCMLTRLCSSSDKILWSSKTERCYLLGSNFFPSPYAENYPPSLEVSRCLRLESTYFSPSSLLLSWAKLLSVFKDHQDLFLLCFNLLSILKARLLFWNANPIMSHTCLKPLGSFPLLWGKCQHFLPGPLKATVICSFPTSPDTLPIKDQFLQPCSCHTGLLWFPLQNDRLPHIFYGCFWAAVTGLSGWKRTRMAYKDKNILLFFF